MPKRRPPRAPVLTVADVADIVAFATAKYGEVALERMPFERAQREYEDVTARNVERRDAALTRACVAGAILLSDIDVARERRPSALEARLDDFIEGEAARRRPRPRLRLVASRRCPAQPDRTGGQPNLRLVLSANSASSSKPTGLGR